MSVVDYEAVRQSIAKNKKRQFSLLLGNGFSMSYSPDIFSWNALHRFVDDLDNELLRALFRVVGTQDFEKVMRQLGTFSALCDVLELERDVQSRIESAALDLQRSLIDAIRALHPEHVYKIPQEKCDACAEFLRPYLNAGGSLFTTNYDLLLYWVLMRAGLPSVDGFGRDLENETDEYVNEEDLEYSELRWGRNLSGQNVHYVHGALPLFDTGTEIIKEEYAQNYLLKQIANRIDEGDYPVFVTAGDAEQKLTHIRHNPYLQYSYEALATLQGSLVTFGFNFGEQDSHIIDAIQRAAKQDIPNRLWSLYIGAFSEDDVERAQVLRDRLACKVHVFDSKTAPVWG